MSQAKVVNIKAYFMIFVTAANLYYYQNIFFLLMDNDECFVFNIIYECCEGGKFRGMKAKMIDADF
jgi:hypothetical protein